MSLFHDYTQTENDSKLKGCMIKLELFCFLQKYVDI